MWPVILWIILMCLSIGMNLMLHGQPKEGNYNFGTAAMVVIIHTSLLYWGGFFDVLSK